MLKGVIQWVAGHVMDFVFGPVEEFDGCACAGCSRSDCPRKTSL